MRFKHTLLKHPKGKLPKLYFIHAPTLPYSILSFWFRAGSRFEPATKAGLAHLLEHLLMKRTIKFPDPIARTKNLEGKGILYNAFTSQDPVYFYTLQDSRNLMHGFNYLLEGVTKPLIKKESISSEKKVVFNEVKRAANNQITQLWNLANKGLWPKSGLAHEPLGTITSLKRITPSDLVRFKNAFYRIGNLTMVVISPESKDFEKAIGFLNSLPSEPPVSLPQEKLHNPQKLIVGKNSSSLVQLAISFRTRGAKTENEAMVLRFIKNYLAGGWISRFIQRSRLEKNLTYWVNGYSRDLPDTGVLRFIFSTERKKLKEAIDIIKEEVELLKASKISPEELEKHKNSIRIGISSNSLSPRDLLMHYGWSALVYSDGPISIDEYLNRFDNLDADTILRASRKHLKTFSLAILGNVSEKDTQLF